MLVRIRPHDLSKVQSSSSFKTDDKRKKTVRFNVFLNEHSKMYLKFLLIKVERNDFL